MHTANSNDQISPRGHVPTAIYYEDADSLEYVRMDTPCVYRRVDELLTLIVSLDERIPIGFCIKGFRNFYLRHLQAKYKLSDGDFIELVNIVQEALTTLGDQIFIERERREAYEEALSIADKDKVLVRELPKVA